MSKPRKSSMGNKPPTRKSDSSSPSLLTAFGFSRQKRSSVGGDEGTPPKRSKSTVKVESTAHCEETAQMDNRTIVVDLTQSSSSCESVSVRNAAIDSNPTRRGQRARIIRIDDDSVDTHQTTPVPNTKTTAPSPISPPKPTATTCPQRPSPLRPVNALALVRVLNPNHILCTTAVAQARNSSSPFAGSQSMYKLFPGATLGRTSNSSRNDPTFVDIGIESTAKGVSRKHLKVLDLRTTPNDYNYDHDERSVLTSQSAASDRAAGPTLLLRVLPHPHPPKTTVKVVVHRTRRNRRRTMELKQGECKTLRIGDAIEFLSDVHRYYCVVGFHDEGSDVVAEGGGAVDGVGVASEREAVCEDERGGETRSIGGSQWGQSEMTQGGEDVDMDGGETDLPASTDGPRATLDGTMVSKEENRKDIIGSSVGESTALDAIKADSEKAAATRVPTGTAPDSHRVDTNNHSGTDPFSHSTDSDEHRKCLASAVPAGNAAAGPAKPHGLDSPTPTEKIIDVAATHARKEKTVVPIPTIKKGDFVRVMYEVSDAFGLFHEEWHYGTVGLVRTNLSRGNHIINVTLGSGESDKLEYPNPDVEKVDDIAKVYSTPLKIGDFVECNFQDYKWYHGRVADLSEDGTTCEVLYHDKDYEVNVPTDQNKIRLAMPCPSNYEWLINKPTLIGRKGLISSVDTPFRGELCIVFHDGSEFSIPRDDVVRGHGAHLLSNCKPPKMKNNNYDWLVGGAVLIGRKGVVKDAPRDDSNSMFRVVFEDGSVESILRDEVVKGAFSSLLQGVGINRQYIWPGSEKFNNNAKQQSDTKLNKEVTKPSLNRGNNVSNKKATVEFEDGDVDGREPIPGHSVVFRASLYPSSHGGEDEDIAYDERDFDDPDAEFRFIGTKKVALLLPPGIPNMLWHALNCPEAKTGANMLHEFLCVHDRVPGPDMIRKFWQLIVKGPKADGHNVYFKEPFMTELASQYVYGLIHHGKRLIRSDGSTLFGPSEWNDIESLLSQSIDQTENMVAGKRLADGLHLAARGSKVLYMMLQYELHDVNTMSVLSNSFDTMSLQTKPTVKLFRHHSRGIRDALKSVVKHTTKCLVRHSRFILDVEDFHPESQSCRANYYDDSCRIESRECFSNLANVVCYAAFLFCVAEKVPINDQCVLLLIRDEFEKELHRCLDDAPEMDKASTNNFVRTLRETFLVGLSEDFAMPLFVGLAKMMGFEKDLRLLGYLVE